MPHQKWEYRYEHRQRKTGLGGVKAWDKDLPAQLASFGEQGWELVTVIPGSSDWGPSQAGITTEELWVFKRPKIE